jgi:hypothetical protein
MGKPRISSKSMLAFHNVRLSITQVLRLETTPLQFNRYQAVEPAMKEEQVEREILIANLQWNFGTNKAKVAAHFDEEPPKAIEEPAM